MQNANPASALPSGLSWCATRTRRIVAAVAALALAAAMAVTVSAPVGEASAAAGDDAAVVAGGSWSTTRNMLRYDGPGFDVLGRSWN